MTDENVKKTCPICNSNDSIQRLSAIVASGTIHGAFSGPSGGVIYSEDETETCGGYTTLSETSMSNLVLLVSFPDKPRLPGIIFTPGGVVFFVIVMLVIGLMTLELGFIAMILLWVWLRPVVGDPKQEIAKYTKESVEWRLAKEYWLSLYYCHKDGIVFDPSRNEYCLPEETVAFVWRHIQEVPLQRFENVYEEIVGNTRKKSLLLAKVTDDLGKIVDDFLLDIKRNN